MNATNLNDSTIEKKVQALVWYITGEPASKANSRKIALIGGRPRVIKSAKALEYEEIFRSQAVPINPLLEGDVKVTIFIHYASRRPDLDESLILDLLQGVAYVNDRQVKEKHIIWGLDRDNPRSEIIVETL